MAKEIRISPSILSADFSCLREEIKSIEEAGADELHLDVMDGHFVPNITFGPVIVKAVKRITELPISAHFMITYPEKYVMEFIHAGCSAISFHPDAEGDPISIIETIHKNNAKAGLVINPDKPVKAVELYLDRVDFILVMSVYPGFAEQKFIPDVISKIKEVRSLAPGLDIAVDGGINDKTVDSVIEAGANIIVSASYIFSSRNRKYAIRRLRGKNG